MKKKNHLPVIWDNRKFRSIGGFDCRIISLDDGEDCAGLFTCLPISPLDFRKDDPTKASVRIVKDKLYVNFYITDDWGKEEVMKIPKSMKKEIKSATESARKMELLV